MTDHEQPQQPEQPLEFPVPAQPDDGVWSDERRVYYVEVLEGEVPRCLRTPVARRLAIVRETFKLPEMTVRWLVRTGPDRGAAVQRLEASKQAFEAQGVLRRWPEFLRDWEGLSALLDRAHPRTIYLRAERDQYRQDPAGQFTLVTTVTHEALHTLQYAAHFDLTGEETEAMARLLDHHFPMIRRWFLRQSPAGRREFHRAIWRREVPGRVRRDLLVDLLWQEEQRRARLPKRPTLRLLPTATAADNPTEQPGE